MTNVVHILTRQPIIEAPPPVIALEPMPSWVTSDFALNRTVTRMQQFGWTVRATPDRHLWCWHPRIVKREDAPLSFYEAVMAQMEIEAEQSKKGEANV